MFNVRDEGRIGERKDGRENRRRSEGKKEGKEVKTRKEKLICQKKGDQGGGVVEKG